MSALRSFQTFAAVALLICLCLAFSSLPHTSALAPPRPITQFDVYTNTNCTGPLFTVDTTWQSFTSLRLWQVGFLSVLNNDTDAVSPCNGNFTSNAASSFFTCIDTDAYAGTGYGGVLSTGWNASNCASTSNNDIVWRYLAAGGQSNSSTLDSTGCQVGTVFCANCSTPSSRATTVGMRIKCAVPGASKSHAAPSLSSVVAVTVAMLASLVLCLVSHV